MKKLAIIFLILSKLTFSNFDRLRANPDLQQFMNNQDIIDQSKTGYRILTGEHLLAMPFQSGNVYKLADLLNSDRTWNDVAAAKSSYPIVHDRPNAPQSCPAGLCSNGVACIGCYVIAKCKLNNNVLSCERLNSGFDYPPQTLITWEPLEKGPRYALQSENGIPNLVKLLTDEECKNV